MSLLKEMSHRGIGLAAATLLAVALAACSASAAAPAASPTTSSFKLQSEYVKLVQDVGPSVVLIESNVGLGSGIIFDAQGDIVTNNHVVAGSPSFLVVLSNGKQYQGSLVGSYAPDDLAVIRIQATRPASGDVRELLESPGWRYRHGDRESARPPVECQ